MKQKSDPSKKKYMSDEQIVELYWNREERAIKATTKNMENIF